MVVGGGRGGAILPSKVQGTLEQHPKLPVPKVLRHSVVIKIYRATLAVLDIECEVLREPHMHTALGPTFQIREVSL